MNAVSWFLFAVCAGAALLLVLHLYRRREMPGRGRGLLAGLRWAAVALLILLVFDPELPDAGAAGPRGTQVIADASASMALPTRAGGLTRWARASEQARQSAGAREVLLFGDQVRTVRPDSLPTITPTATSSRLLPALQAASEAGVRRVLVLTDGGIEDAAEVSRWLPRLGIEIDYRTIGEPVANASVAEIETPAWAQAGEPLEIRFGIAATGGDAGARDVVVMQGERVLATERVAMPEPGRIVSGTLRFTPEAAPDRGLVRYDVRLSGADATPDDDVRSTYIFVTDEPAGVALVSFVPDWEPRFLTPVLEQALGVPVRGYLRAREGDYVRVAAGTDAGVRATEEEVLRVAASADLVVLHGVGGESPAWVAETMARAPRVLVFPSGEASLGSLPVRPGRVVPGDWYLAADVPPSPIAALLAGLEFSDVPPLTALQFAAPPAGAWTPLLVSSGRRGPPTPIAMAGELAGRRWAVALGEGYWRWSFRGGESKQVYARLWGALGGWLVQEQGALAAAPVRPLERVVPRGAPVRWVAAGLGPDSLAVRITDIQGGAVRDTIVPTSGADTASSGALEPGHYRYDVHAFADGAVAASAQGEFTVESYTAEFTRPSVPLATLRAGAVPVGPDARSRPGRPLHASAWPYFAILLLIAAEWVLRRRWGLR